MAYKTTVVCLVVIVVCVASVCEAGKGRKKGGRKRYSGKCKPQITAEYELAFQAAWLERTYPRMFPKYRPSAEWSKLVGKQNEIINNIMKYVSIIHSLIYIQKTCALGRQVKYTLSLPFYMLVLTYFISAPSIFKKTKYSGWH